MGLALFLSIIGFALWSALKAAQWFGRAGDTQMEIVARAMVVALVGILAADFFITEQYGKQLWLLLGLGPALLGVAKRTYPAAEPEPASRKRKLRAVPMRAF